MRVLLILIIPLFLLYGCGSTDVRETAQVSPDIQAKSLFNDGKFELAAIEYLKISELYPEDSDKYRLRAAHAYIEANLADKALLLLEPSELQGTDREAVFYGSVLRAKIELDRRQPDRAQDLLPSEIPENTAPEVIITFYSVLAEVLEQQGRYVDAVGTRIRLAGYAVDSAQMQNNTARLWNRLINLEQEELGRLRESVGVDASPWLELARISENLMSDRPQLEQALEDWIENYPRHPAYPQITSQILSISEEFNTRPQHIALLLPLSGMYERYAETIRDGFLASWFNEDDYKPIVRIYNTNAENVVDIYQTAVKNGADFIVGPLEKEAVRALNGIAPMPVRTLALNQIEQPERLPADIGLSMPDLIQFGLPPEEEARLVASRAVFEGHSKVLIITPADDYGKRINDAFRNEWRKLGGRILEEIHYNPQTADFITPVKDLLNIANSEARISSLRQRLGRNIVAVTRVRQDPDFVFMVASNLNARQIVPHLRFFRADAVPIYTISHVYTGRSSPGTDRDLDGVEFVDMPWVLDLSASSVAANVTFPRYYAFGADAFSLIPRIGELLLSRDYRFPGKTGDVYISDEGIVHRTLPWARFTDGRIQRINTGILN